MLTPEKKDACMKGLILWLIKEQPERVPPMMDLAPIFMKHLSQEEEIHEFAEFLESPEGVEEFRRRLRFEAWRAGLAGPSRFE